MKRIPELDGVRGVAILLVILFHAQVPGFSRGWVGVDVFFALSGYLITSLLLKEQAKTGQVSFKAFYIRRALRLYPALLIALPVYWAWPYLAEGPHGTWGIIASLFYCSNFLYIAQGWAGIPNAGFTWSLSVEEQFYLLWPVMLAFILRKRINQKAIGVVLILLFAVLLSLRLTIFHDSESTALHRLIWTRPDTIFLGCALALLRVQVPRMNFLRFRPLVWVGEISYSLYLWHNLGFYLMKWLGLASVPFEIAAAFGLACLSFYFIERPFLRLKDRLGQFTASRSSPAARQQPAPPSGVHSATVPS